MAPSVVEALLGGVVARQGGVEAHQEGEEAHQEGAVAHLVGGVEALQTEAGEEEEEKAWGPVGLGGAVVEGEVSTMLG